MSDKYKEWLAQADYDMDTAEAMYSSGRYCYAVFMCHLCLEKALKGLYQYNLGVVPPKTHNLLYLIGKVGKSPDQELERFMTRLNTAGVVTRYPDDLAKIQATFTEVVTKDIILRTKEGLKWIKAQF